VETGRLLELFDRQMRRELAGPSEWVGAIRLALLPGWSAVVWSQLDETTADAEIARAVARLRELPGHVEWKLYGHDRPADLPQRLIAAGLEPDDEEALLVAAVERAATPLDADVRVAADAAGVERFMELEERVFGHRTPAIERELLQALEHERPPGLAVVAFVDGEPVSGGRIDFVERSDFAGLFGGGTLPDFRGRGLYRATVAKRAALARERGYRYLYVDALPTSRPILERLGFVQISTTTPFTLVPSRARPASSSG
jgi:GNAT superfamily N-acetyltransferase